MPKKIVLLADGTGNGLLVQISNICRLWQALDTATKGQIVLYIPGVGTEGFRPLAMLDGATGLGVPSNVRKLYRFLCANWEFGDEIYMFGFSRGAFTIRTLIDLIRIEGLLPNDITRVEMRRLSMAAWRSYRKHDARWDWSKPWKISPTFPIFRAIRDMLLFIWRRALGHRSFASVKAARPSERSGESVKIKFVGLFDTVEAYGVPVEELRAAINWVWPISFGGNHRISEKVECIRHALSLDDERTTFHPIRIDQKSNAQYPDRIKEFWFAGVHSDVGGGYPDSSQALVPFVWILGEAVKAGLVLRNGELDEFRTLSSPFGPVHDSRAGMAVLYRYHPRVIAQSDEEGNSYGPTLVHHSVIERIVHGSDNYAPISLPDDIQISLPDGSQFADTLNAGFRQIAGRDDAISSSSAPLNAHRMRRACEAIENLQKPSRTDINLALDLVWLRRVNYFATITLLGLLVLLPWLGDSIERCLRWLASLIGSSRVNSGIDAIGGGAANFFRGIVDSLQAVTPSYVAPYWQSLRSHPLIAGVLIAFFVMLLWGGGNLGVRINDYARRAWRSKTVVTGQRGLPQPGVLMMIARKMRLSPVAAYIHRAASGYLLPIIWGVALAIAVLPPLAGLVSRWIFDYQVGAGKVCYGTDNPKKWPPGSAQSAITPRLLTVASGGPLSKLGWSRDREQENGFRTSDPCWASGFKLERGVAYRLFINIDTAAGDQPWFDQLIMTDVGGFESDSFIRKFFWSWFLRWPSAGWFQPVARIGEQGDAEWPLVSLDKSGPIAMNGDKCTQLPIRYDQTPERQAFCHTANAPTTCAQDRLDLPWDAQLPNDELEAANAAWERSVFHSGANGAACVSAYPRKAFVSDFVATKSGELFLFVNDAVGFPFSRQPQPPYRNNRGTATITLQRVSPPPNAASR